MPEFHDVVVIGAGMAGLSAARYLSDVGHDVVVVEGRERLGGRLHTVQLGDASVDLGGAWIHGPIGNPLTPVAEAAGVVGSQSSWIENPATSMAVTVNGERLDTVAFARGAQHFRAGFDTVVGPNAGVATIGDLVRGGAINSTALTGAELAGFDWAARLGMQCIEASDIDQISVAGTPLDERPDGNVLLSDGGYVRLVDEVARGLDVRTGWVVEAVSARDGSARDGRWLVSGVADGEPVSVSARAVVVTVPVAVLQRGSVAFDPPLGAEVVDRLGRFGVGRAEKIAVRFAQSPWDATLQTLSIVGADDTDPMCSWNFLPTAPIAVSYAAGSRADAMNTLPDDEVLSLALDRLTTVFGPLPEVVDWVRTNWAIDAFSAGAYTFSACAQAGDDRVAMREAVAPGLWFAGAAYADHYATADGAFSSGRECAERVSRYLSAV